MMNVEFYSDQRFFDTQRDTTTIFVSLSTHFILRKYIRKDGASPIYLHVHISGQRERISLNLFCPASDWNKAKQRAASKYVDLNLILDNIDARITEIKTQYRLSGQTLTIDKFMTEFRSDFSRVDFLPFFLNIIQNEKKVLAKGTFRRYMAVYRKLKRWKKTILFSDISYSFIEKVKKHFRDLGNCENTIAGNLKVIRKALRIAKKHGIQFPLEIEDIHIKKQFVNRVNLKPFQLEKLYNYYFSDYIPKEWKLILGYFLFSCFTGLRISDINNLERCNIKDKFQIRMIKTKKIITITLIKKAKQILMEDPRLFKNHLSPEYINRELKKIMKAVNIKEKVTFHVARHTFATNFLRVDGNVVKLSQLLGHSSIKTTMIYVHITDEEKNSDINLLDNLF